MIGIIIMFWILNQFLVLIILLNFLIAIISESYEMAMSQQVISTYLHRCQLNNDCLLILAYLQKLEELNLFLFADSRGELA